MATAMKTSAGPHASPNAKNRLPLRGLAALTVAALTLAGPARAQLKVGDNPTIINANAVLEAESVSKGLLPPRLALTSTSLPAPLTAHVAGMVVYNTATANDVTPGFYYNNGAAWVSFQSACTCGDIKSGLQTASHGDWKLMDGSAYGTNRCGLTGNMPNASGTVQAMGGTVGTVTSATALAQNQLPNVTLTGTSNTTGAHTHGSGNGFSFVTTGPGSNWVGGSASFGSRSTTAEAGAHSHTVTTSSINGGVTQQALSTTNLPRLNVNYFVCVN